MVQDVPSPIDLRLMVDAREWEARALAERPWRAEFFAQVAAQLTEARPRVERVLELGSGPGFLAEHLLRALPSIAYVALDFSPAMHELAAARLEAFASRVTRVERSYRDAGWTDGLGRFDAVVTHQAVHELRHKAHAPALHAAVRDLLAPAGIYLVCDHFVGEGGQQNDQLYMTVAEQRDALRGAGFSSVDLLLQKGGLVLHRARHSASRQPLVRPDQPGEAAGGSSARRRCA